MEAISNLELQNFEKYLDQKDLRIRELEKENIGLKSKMKTINLDYADLQRKLNTLIDQSDQLTIEYRQMETKAKDQEKQIKTEHYDQLASAAKSNTKIVDELK